MTTQLDGARFAIDLTPLLKQQRATPDSKKLGLSDVPRRAGPPVGSVDGTPLVNRAAQNGATVPCRERGFPDRTAGVGRPSLACGNPRCGCDAVQQRLAVFRQQWGKTPAGA